MLMVIAVIGIITSMALAVFGGASESADDAKNRRNAQEIASVASSASAAGVDFLVPNDEAATISNLSIGITASEGVFKNRVYKLPTMHETELQGAMQYLTITESELLYDYVKNP
jgi:type II secretory pathway pseudopilin PulG